MKAISVSELNAQIKAILEPHFEIVYVEGEVSEVHYHTKSGHLYFSLKDENSSISCAMWRNNVKKMKFELKKGDKVYVFGAISLYTPRGEYKLIATEITPSGIGELQLAFERLKEELEKLGYFDESKKKPIPKYPKRVALITSKTGAALTDMLRVANKRWKLTKFYLFDALVQGDGAAEDIARKIKIADNYRFSDNRGFDLIIVARGGGSKEDLWAFNERVVADAIFLANTPIISAIGHERDYLISDFVADKRAATPSNAIEIILPDENEIRGYIETLFDSFEIKTKSIIEKKEFNLKHLFDLFIASSPQKKVEKSQNEIKILGDRFNLIFDRFLSSKKLEVDRLKNSFLLKSPKKRILQEKEGINFLKEKLKNDIKRVIDKKSDEVNRLKNSFSLLNPKNREKKGFVELVKDGKRWDLKDIKKDDIFYIQNTSNRVQAKALRVE